jgi:hypothetical protein
MQRWSKPWIQDQQVVKYIPTPQEADHMKNRCGLDTWFFDVHNVTRPQNTLAIYYLKL